MQDARGRTRIVQQRVSIDERTLQKIADVTGGRFYRARNTEALSDIYAEIDALEKTEVAEEHYYHYTDLSVTPTVLGGFELPPLLIFPLLVLLGEILLAATRYRSLP